MRWPLYFANPTGEAQAAMTAGVLGFIDTPQQGNIRPDGVVWCADNGCFGKGFDERRWWGWLRDNAVDAANCVFATAPDVVGDAAATMKRSRPWLPRIRGLGYPVAFVAQDGQENQPMLWTEFDVLFIGGTTSWKLGSAARSMVSEAKQRGIHVHMGRVNSLRRYRYAEAIGCDSVDGTYLVFGPDTNLPKLLGWVRNLDEQKPLFGLGAS